MFVFIVVTYDTTSFSADERVEIQEVFLSHEDAKGFANNLILDSCQGYEIKKYEIRGG